MVSCGNSDQDICIQCDASEYGTTAVLLQEDRPVYYASKSFARAEQNYRQIDKEVLEILFLVQKFHDYAYGRPIKIISDHKSLERTFRKSILKAQVSTANFTKFIK